MVLLVPDLFKPPAFLIQPEVNFTIHMAKTWRVVHYTHTVTVRELKLRSVTVHKEVCTFRKTFPAVTFF